MYSVFIVDDEPIVLEGIRTKIDWEASGFTFAGEAGDGEIALSMIHEIKPDILITDIKMPFMDGLELAAAVKKNQPWIKIIILTGHDEFEYAKKAISIGVEEYLLKPFSAKDVLDTLQKTALEIDRERKQLSDISQMKAEIKSQEKIIQKEFLVNLVHGSADLDNIMQKCQELGIQLVSRYYRISISRIQSKSENLQNQQTACSLLNSYSSSWEQVNSFFHHTNWFVCICKGMTQTELEETVYRTAETIEYIIGQNTDCTALTAIGKTVEHLSSISDSYVDAKNIMKKNESTKENRIVNSDDGQMENTGLLDIKDSDPMVDRLKYASKADVSAIIEESLKLIHDNPGQFNFFASYLMADMIFSVAKLVENLGGDLKEIRPEILQRSFVDESVQNENKFTHNLESILTFVLEYRDSKMSGKYGDVILRAKKFIDEHYDDPNTTLTTVANEVCLSPNHFSAVFSQECKTTFIEYLTNVRIENAKRLLRETDMKGYDIAYDCGFSDPHYFSYIFKKNTGLSPREYKGGL